MSELRNLINLVEAKSKQDLVLEKLPYTKSGLAPVMSQATIDYHYGELAKGYVDRYNKGKEILFSTKQVHFCIIFSSRN